MHYQERLRPWREDERRDDERRDDERIRDDDRMRDRRKYYDGRDDERGVFSRAADEVRSWVGDDEASRRRHLDDIGYWRTRERFGNLSVRDVMSCDVTTVYPNDPVRIAARLMKSCDCGALPVIERHNQLIGMITDRDITIRLVSRGLDTRTASVGDCMTYETFKCHVDDSIEKCLDQLAKHQVRRLPVVNDRQQVVGMITQSDIALLAGVSPGRGERQAVAETLSAVSEPYKHSHR